MAENKKGKLVSFQPVFVNGQHRSWVSQKYNETYYVFTLAFDNGDSGESNAKTQNGSYKIGTEYTYTKEVTVYQDRQIVKIKGLKDANSSFSGGGSGKSGGYKMSDEDKKKFLNKVALRCVNSSMIKINEEYNPIYTKLRNWLYTRVFTLGDTHQMASDTLEIAVDYYKNAAATSIISDNIIALANSLVKTINNISWTDPNQQAPSTNSQSYSPPAQQTPPPSQNPAAPPEDPGPEWPMM
jgi:hypothetical protein